MTKDFSTIAYAKLNLDFDHEVFAKEYDEKILPAGYPISSSINAIKLFAGLNKRWGMISPEIYDTGDVWDQPGDAFTLEYIKRERPAWILTQLMQMDLTDVDDPYLVRYSKNGATHFRNETLDPKYKFAIKEKFADLQIWNWIQNNLPFEKINGVHCVSIEPGGFAAIHRDNKGMYDNQSSAGISRVFKNGYVVICINISDGGVPLYWSLDGMGVKAPFKVNDSVYITNDYFLHGVPVVETRRRQVRVTGIPTPELWDIIDHGNKVDIGSDYQFVPNYVQWLKDNNLFNRSVAESGLSQQS